MLSQMGFVYKLTQHDIDFLRKVYLVMGDRFRFSEFKNNVELYNPYLVDSSLIDITSLFESHPDTYVEKNMDSYIYVFKNYPRDLE